MANTRNSEITERKSFRLKERKCPRKSAPRGRRRCRRAASASHDFFAWPPSAQPPVLPRDPERAQALGMARNVDHHKHPVAEHVVRPACGAHKAIPVEGLHLRAAPPVRIVADAVDG